MTFQEAQQIDDKRDFTPSYIFFLEYLLEEKESRKIFTLSLGGKKRTVLFCNLPLDNRETK